MLHLMRCIGKKLLFLYYELNCVPLKIYYVETLTQIPQNVTLYRDQIFKETS